MANAAMHMEARVLETLGLKRSSEEGDETKTGDEKKKNGVFVDLPRVKGDAPRRGERVSGRENSSLNPIVAWSSSAPPGFYRAPRCIVIVYGRVIRRFKAGRRT